jgi:hypothetical protein
MQYGIFPERLKYSVIKPIHKNGDKSILQTYIFINVIF